ncbi:MAG TPA: SH3 domain-containing protein, partial [Candidatus Omnitrophota bacterium]|nr:SH3 domain-containing protein [Candidatus Omnitrophota bacterium]
KRGALLLARNEYAWVALFLLGVLAGVHLMSLSFNWRRNLQTVVIMVGLLALIFHGFFWVLHERFFARRAIVLKDSSVLFEPREGATAHFQVYEGDPVEVLKIQDSWGKVARFDGKEGWITTDHFERLRRGKTNQ